MSEKCTVDLALVLPGIPDERNACAGRLTDLLQAEGIERAHVVSENGTARLTKDRPWSWSSTRCAC